MIMIRELNEEDKPRERMAVHGVESLSNEELLSVLLGTGCRRQSVLEMSHRLMMHTDGLVGLSMASMDDLMAIEGIGTAKSAILLAAIELGKRISKTKVHKLRVSHSGMVYECLRDHLRDMRQEVFGAITLNTKNEIMHVRDIAKGTLNATIVHPRDVFHLAIKSNAAAIIVYHNHPSGNPTPSIEDDLLTERLLEVGKVMGIPLLDHIVVGNPDYYSYKDNGKLIT